MTGTKSRAFDVRAELATPIPVSEPPTLQIPPPVPPGEASIQIAPELLMPADLDTASRVVWLKLAPHAIQARTLTPGTVEGFALLVRCILLERELSVSKGRGGSDHRWTMQRVEVGLAKFGLMPFGKPLTDPPKPADPFGEFDTEPR